MFKLEELFKLIGELTGYGPTSTSVHVTFNPARQFNVYGESEGYDNNNWGYAVSTKLCSTETIEVSAQDKQLDSALWKLAQAIVDKNQDIQNRRAKETERTKSVMAAFLEKGLR